MEYSFLSAMLRAYSILAELLYYIYIYTVFLSSSASFAEKLRIKAKIETDICVYMPSCKEKKCLNPVYSVFITKAKALTFY